jgi:membrane fusion protein (multidrug efflux system)
LRDVFKNAILHSIGVGRKRQNTRTGLEMNMAVDRFTTALLATAAHSAFCSNYGVNRIQARVFSTPYKGTLGADSAAGYALTKENTMKHLKTIGESAVARESALQSRGVNAVITLVIVTVLLAAAGCSRAESALKPAPPLTVAVAQVVQKDVPIYSEWVGTLDGSVNADIKAEVSGYLVKQEYTEGSFVSSGQLLFQIDPRPFRAALEQAEGQLAQAQGQLEQARAQLAQAEAQVAVAQANQGRVQLDVDRYKPLAEQQAITQQDLDNATQNNIAAKAQLQAAKAQVETARAQITAATAAVQANKAAADTARINLGFTRLVSPIDGIPGIAQLQVGALVGPTSPPITTVSTINPIKVYFTASEQEYLEYRRRFPTTEKVQANNQRLELELILADGTPYPHKGKFYFADRAVDVRTGAIRLAGLFPNPDNVLRPGQYGKVRTSTQTRQAALLVPQQAVIDLQGTHQLAVVDDANKVSIRAVKLGETVGRDWIVHEGVQPGERVIIDGLQKVRQGSVVNPQSSEAR